MEPKKRGDVVVEDARTRQYFNDRVRAHALACVYAVLISRYCVHVVSILVRIIGCDYVGEDPSVCLCGIYPDE